MLYYYVIGLNSQKYQHIFLKKDFIYLFMRDTEKEAEGEAGSMHGARHGTQSWDSETTPWAKGRH